jgi:hypothetical protein
MNAATAVCNMVDMEHVYFATWKRLLESGSREFISFGITKRSSDYASICYVSVEVTGCKKAARSAPVLSTRRQNQFQLCQSTFIVSYQAKFADILGSPWKGSMPRICMFDEDRSGFGEQDISIRMTASDGFVGIAH